VSVRRSISQYLVMKIIPRTQFLKPVLSCILVYVRSTRLTENRILISGSKMLKVVAKENNGRLRLFAEKETEKETRALTFGPKNLKRHYGGENHS
jgi:hypothetical protein